MAAGRRAVLAGSLAAGAAFGAHPGMAQEPQDLGRRLFRRVVAYAARPHHRTGSDEQRASTDWFEAELAAAGFRVERRTYGYPRYVWQASVRAGDRVLETLPLHYEGVGEIATDAPFARPVVLPSNYDTADLVAALAEARAEGARLAVFATFGRFGDAPPRPALIGVNADPARQGSGVPALLVSGHHLDALAQEAVSAAVSARIEPARADNVLAFGGTGGGAPVVVTTPLTGWFACAGERGTGIAVAIELAAALARERPVAVLGTTGHELENWGIREQLRAGLGFAPHAVVHVGASLAAGHRRADGRIDLWPGRFVASSPPAGPDTAVGAALRAGGFAQAPRFLGEGAIWRGAVPPETPLLSFAGSFPLFHTPNDLPEAATSPALLERVYASVRDAVAALLAA